MYHNHEYYFEKNRLVCSNDRIIGKVLLKDGECKVEINEKEKEYVSNTNCKNEIIKLLNQFNEMER